MQLHPLWCLEVNVNNDAKITWCNTCYKKHATFFACERIFIGFPSSCCLNSWYFPPISLLYPLILFFTEARLLLRQSVINRTSLFSFHLWKQVTWGQKEQAQVFDGISHSFTLSLQQSYNTHWLLTIVRTLQQLALFVHFSFTESSLLELGKVHLPRWCSALQNSVCTTALKEKTHCGSSVNQQWTNWHSPFFEHNFQAPFVKYELQLV